MSEASPDFLASEAQKRVGLIVGDRYTLDSLLGLGACGAVYRAREGQGQTVAIKILDPERLANEVATRFIRESEVMLSIHHPNVVHTLASGRDSGTGLLYLVMPLLHGEDLEKVLRRTGSLEPRIAVRLAIQAARGLAAAHRLGIVHRDVKPGNLFIDRAPDGRVSVRVCDFGIAKSGSSPEHLSLTRTGSQLGTPDYISPEQLKNSKSVDARADIWGLGATLYETLAGGPPFSHHERVFDVIAAILGEEVPSISDRAPWIDKELARIVHGTLRRDPSQRPSSIQELADALLPHSASDAELTTVSLASVSERSRRARVDAAAAPRESTTGIPAPFGHKGSPVGDRAVASHPVRGLSASVHPGLSRPVGSRRRARQLWLLGILALTAASIVIWPTLQPFVRELLEPLVRLL